MQNDFLSSISSRAIHATRAEHVEGGIRPRLASLYEPSQMGIQLIQAESVEADAPRTPQPAAQPDADYSTGRPRQPETNQPLQRQETRTSVEQRQDLPAVHVIEQLRVEHFSETPRPKSPPLTSQPAQPPSLPREKIVFQPSAQPPQSPPALSGLMDIQNALESLRSQRNREARQAKNVADERQPDKHLPDSSAEEQNSLNRAKTGVVPEQIIITHKQLQPPKLEDSSRLMPASIVRESKPGPGMLQSEAQPATIHVTIGRIEVKASNPAALPKRGLSPATTMSLEEYLRRRQGGNQ